MSVKTRVKLLKQALEGNILSTSNIPSYLKDRHFKTIDLHKRAINKEFMCQFTMAEIDKVSHLENMVSDNIYLKWFYENYGENEKLVLSIYVFFESILPFWCSDLKTTGREDVLLAQKANSHLLKAIESINKSTDLWLNFQFYWEAYVKDNTNLSRKEIMTSSKWHILQIFSYLAQYLEDIQEVAIKKDNGVPKANSENAHIHYTIQNLKKILTEHAVPEHKHIKCISHILMGVMKENVPEDTIRKYLSRK